uniref:Uncharacterized protein n=1 Tax=Meloidogyne enterolobii TaxID=390850 RepID=A0A6V7UHC4_MELEN|nr:unnamed protein product [Meloidogyne enterolobii]
MKKGPQHYLLIQKTNKFNNLLEKIIKLIIEKSLALSVKIFECHKQKKLKTGFQSNIWDKGIEVIRFVKEREKTFREKLEDDFCEGRAVQDLKLKRMRAEMKKDAKEQQASSQ